MKFTAKKGDFDLPLVEADEVAHTHADMNAQIRAGRPVVTRSVRMFGISPEGLMATPDDANRVFQHVARNCGAVVVPHTWVMYPSEVKPPKILDYLGTTDYLPEGFAIGSIVNVLSDLDLPTPDQNNRIARAIQKQRDNQDETPLWWDASTHHFTVATDKAINEINRLYLLDIEPMLEYSLGDDTVDSFMQLDQVTRS